MAAESGKWEDIGLASKLEARPENVVAAPVLGANKLPLEELQWEDFERLQWRILRDVEGLRSALIYGLPGQAQYGLDIVALDPAEEGVALQSKRYQKFGVSDLESAVRKFQETRRPFGVKRFIIGVACIINDTKVIDALYEHRKQLAPTQLELWGKEEISDKLRDHPEIVIQFFGTPTAEKFCLPFSVPLTEIPSADAAIVEEAIARTPEETTGAGKLFRLAGEATVEPARALDLISEGQERLRKAGFGAHAAQYERERFQILIQLDRAYEAARAALDEVWAKLSLGKTASAESSARRVQKISEDVRGNQQVTELAKVAQIAISLHLNPLGDVPNVETLVVGEPNDRLQLAVLASEIALANSRTSWLSEASEYLIELAASAEIDEELRIRLRILIAEATDDWRDVLEDARKRRLGNDFGALVTARYARNQAIHQKFAEADALWNEASGGASLKKRWVDASTWVFSRRAFRTRWRHVGHDDLLTMQIALNEMGPSESVLRRDEQAYVSALENFRAKKLRPAAIAVQRALRQSIVISDWVGEQQSRGLLGAILSASDEPELAAHHLALGADVESIENLADKYSGNYIDVVELLGAPNYWTVGTAFRLLAAESDLIPDEALNQVVEQILAELRDSDSDGYIDARHFSTSRYRGAIKTLAGVANRLTGSQAEEALNYFEKQPPVELHHYRFHDDDEAITVARIACNHSVLQERAIAHLVPLLARAQTARGSVTLGALKEASEISREHLENLARGGDRWALETLASHEESAPSSDAVRAAFDRLTKPLEHRLGVFTVGTNAIGDSNLLKDVSSEERKLVVTELLHRADDPLASPSDRNDYLLAASKLVGDFDVTTRQALFSESMRIARDLQASAHDEFNSQFTHKLGQLRVTTAANRTKAAALYLAACLADDAMQSSTIKKQAYLLLGTSDRSDYLVAQALHLIDSNLDDDLGLLAGQSWGPRSIAAIRWVQHCNPEHLGQHLASDRDPRVRRALAGALAEAAPLPGHEKARHLLESDPAYSVRSVLIGLPSSEGREPSLYDSKSAIRE